VEGDDPVAPCSVRDKTVRGTEACASGISEKVLTDQLRQLEADRVIKRTSDGGAPARVDYGLSRAGEELIPEMEELCHWGSKHWH